MRVMVDMVWARAYHAPLRREGRVASPPLPPLFLLVPVLLFHVPRFFRLEHRPPRHAQGVELAAHQGLHHFHLPHHPHAADGAHHVAGRFELLHELPDLDHVHAGAPRDAAATVAVEGLGLHPLFLGHRVVDGLHPAHLHLDVAVAHAHLLDHPAHARDHLERLLDVTHLLHLAHLAHEVFEGELALLHLRLELGG